MSNRMFLRSIVIGASLLAAVTAQAIQTATFNVTANVVQTCTAQATDLTFGNVNVLLNQEWDTTSTITLFCGNGVPFRVGLDAGQGAGGSTTTRVMTNTGGGGGTINYLLYQDNGHTVNWGNTDTVDTQAATGTGADQTLNVYGVIPAGQTTAAYGLYADIITVNVYY